MMVQDFHNGRDSRGDERVEQDVKDIDLSNPVEIATFPPPEGSVKKCVDEISRRRRQCAGSLHGSR